jgi:hypothetical protein
VQRFGNDVRTALLKLDYVKKEVISVIDGINVNHYTIENLSLAKR